MNAERDGMIVQRPDSLGGHTPREICCANPSSRLHTDRCAMPLKDTGLAGVLSEFIPETKDKTYPSVLLDIAILILYLRQASSR